MSFKKATLILVVIVILLGIAFVLDSFQDESVRLVDSFEECAELYPVMESYPRQCKTPEGRHFVEEIDDQVPSDDENGTTTAPGNNSGDVERVPEELFPSDPTAPEGETSRAPGAYDGCMITGCSAQVCTDVVDNGIETNCEFQESHACYSRLGMCERRDNTCGWRQTEALNSCVSNAS